MSLTTVSCACDKPISFRWDLFLINDGYWLYKKIWYTLSLWQADVTCYLLREEAAFSPQVCIWILIVSTRNLKKQKYVTQVVSYCSTFYIHGSMHRDYVLIRSNKVQQYAGIYLLQVYSTYFGHPSRPSSGVQKTVTTASGTGRWTVTMTCTFATYFTQ